MGRKIIGVLVLCLVLVGVTACAGDSDSGGQQLEKVVRGDLSLTVSGTGSIGVSNEVRLVFGSGGKIKEIYVEEGDNVRKGEALAELDTSALELALAQALVARDEVEYNLDQLKDVLHAAHDRIKLTEEQLELAEKAVAEARRQLDEAIITAPFDGVVASVYSKEGDTVPSPTMAPQPVIHLIDLGSMELNVEVDEVDIAEVEAGQKAVIEIDALPDVEPTGKVISISPLSTAMAGVVVYDVKIGLDAPDPRLRVGMSATADIVISERSDVLLVPDRAITRDSQGNTVVKVMVGEEVQERPVVTGISDGFQTEITSGLEEGETVVIEKRTSSSGGGLF